MRAQGFRAHAAAVNSLFPTEQARLFERARQRLGLTSNYALARRLNWSSGQVSNYASGRRTMDVEQALHFIRTTGIDAVEVLTAAVADRQRPKANQTNGRQEHNVPGP